MVQKLVMGGIVIIVLGISLMAISYQGARNALDYYAGAHPDDLTGPCVGDGQDPFVCSTYQMYRDMWFPGLMLIAVGFAMIGAGMIHRSQLQVAAEVRRRNPSPPSDKPDARFPSSQTTRIQPDATETRHYPKEKM